MIIGKFDELTGEPRIEASISLSGHRIGRGVSLLIDTGADTTTIMPDDSRLLGIDIGQMEGTNTIIGIGGTVDTAVRDTKLSFSENRSGLIRHYFLPVDYIRHDQGIVGLPSILGRDILDRWRMNYDPVNGKLEFTVHSADLTV